MAQEGPVRADGLPLRPAVKNGSSSHWWQGLMVLALLLLAGLVLLHRDELTDVAVALYRGRWGYFPAALGLQMVYFAFQAYMYRELLGVWNAKITFARVFFITLTSSAGNKLIPSGGASGLLLFIGEAAREGVNAEVSLLVNAGFYLLDYTGFLIVVMWGVFYLFRRGELNYTEEAAVTIFTSLVMLSFVLFFLALKYTDRIKNFLDDRFNPVRPVLARLKIAFIESLSRIRVVERSWPRAGGRVFAAFLGAVGMQLADIAILLLAFKIVNYSVDPGLVVAGFGLASVLSMASMVPQGIGIYETAMTWLYMQLGIPFGTALSVALLYRGATFWFPIIPGIICMRLAGRRKR